MTFSVRLATREDAQFLPDIERSAGKAFLTLPDLAWIAADEVQSEALHRELIEKGGAWVAVNALDEPVGFLNGEQIGHAFHILEIAVRSELQGRGLGRALIEAAADWAKANAFPTLTLTTFRDVMWNAPFYERLGFQIVDPAKLTSVLRSMLEAESEHGLHGRCAMARRLIDQ